MEHFLHLARNASYAGSYVLFCNSNLDGSTRLCSNHYPTFKLCCNNNNNNKALVPKFGVGYGSSMIRLGQPHELFSSILFYLKALTLLLP